MDVHCIFCPSFPVTTSLGLVPVVLLLQHDWPSFLSYYAHMPITTPLLHPNCWNCLIFLTHCQRLFAVPPNRPRPTGYSTCEGPFLSTDLGCVYLVLEYKTWCEARRACLALDADLAVPAEEDYNALQTFLLNNVPGEPFCKHISFTTICRINLRVEILFLVYRFRCWRYSYGADGRERKKTVDSSNILM